MESEKEIKKLMDQFHYLFDISIDELGSRAEIDNTSPSKALFIRMMIEYINHNYLQYKHGIKEQVEGFITKAELSKNFILTSIDESLLNIPVDEIINLLESSPIEHKRNCFSLNENQIRTHKMLFDLERVFNKLNKENSINFNKTHCLPQTNDNNVLKSTEKKGLNPVNTISLERTPNFGKQNPNKKYEMKAKENKNGIASMYHSPSPVVMSKTKRVVEKKSYHTPEKKNYWLY